ncbi:MAG: phage gp6-like head-tail connector protein, partial [Rickettsiales bacterium]|nr:phage gp6-like head-tail connector protein [Rickettsiales bacterium]
AARRVEITYHTGYGDADDVPMPIKLGMLAHVAQLYDNRGEAVMGALPAQAVSLYLPFREMRL